MTLKIYDKASLSKERPQVPFPADLKMSDHVREHRISQGLGKEPMITWEFIGADDFGTQWNTRQQYEVDAGRDEEPILYTPLYAITNDPGLPKNVSINRVGPPGVFFSAIGEGGETKFATMGSSNQSIPLIDYTVGLEYSQQLVRYNEYWDIPLMERQVGIAHNALLNDIHFKPIINFSYTSANQTAASAVGATLVEKYLRTIEDAINNSTTAHNQAGLPNYRRGPYAILCSVANRFTIERALNRQALQYGFDLQSSALGQIQSIIAYDGWVGTMGKETVTYSGVTANKCYLVDVSPMIKMAYARSYVKFLLDQLVGSEDVSRLIAQQTVWWSSLGTYVSVAAIAEEVTLPTS